MKKENTFKVGDYLYRVDPRRLSIKVVKVYDAEKYNHTTTDYENFAIECEKIHFQLPFDKLPFEFKGLWYFLDEDEANSFLKAQMGM
ncbi:hypothetical protein [Dysgonomonas sp. 511]|uniref:hypothetical protein n=1 Tax=Dysgonomonas sp. 511 TaxID=2302930 RepID=UPI0013CFAB30|nr:hypothetical protein [Dysgonomonas sp. 511]NDV79836.1 hypothetical protein [Dysgonomonas sp. 511]